MSSSEEDPEKANHPIRDTDKNKRARLPIWILMSWSARTMHASQCTSEVGSARIPVYAPCEHRAECGTHSLESQLEKQKGAPPAPQPAELAPFKPRRLRHPAAKTKVPMVTPVLLRGEGKSGTDGTFS